MRKLLLAVLMLSSTLVFATDRYDVDLTNNAVVGVGIKLLDVQAQQQQQAQANKQNVTVQGDVYKAPNIPVSTAYAPNLNPTAQCMGVVSAGGTGVNIGLSFGKSYESKPCNDRELARMFAQLGQVEASYEILCNMNGAQNVSFCEGYRKPLVAKHKEANAQSILGGN